jgi:hypothetical protein
MLLQAIMTFYMFSHPDFILHFTIASGIFYILNIKVLPCHYKKLNFCFVVHRSGK